MHLRTVRLAMGLCTLLAARGVWAQDVVERTAVRNRLFSVEGRSELGLSVGTSFLPQLTDALNFNVNYAYNFSEQWAIEVRAGYAYSHNTDLAEQIRQDFAQNTNLKSTDDLSNMWQIKGNASVGARWSPIYGKMSLVPEVAVHYQVYLWLGAGAAQLHRESVVECISGSRADCGAYQTDDRVAPMLAAALGLRLFLSDHSALRFEVRDYSYADSYRTGLDLDAAVQGQATGTAAAHPGFDNLVQFDFGYTYVF